MRILGIDYGEKKIGVALSSPDGAFALPYGVFANNRDTVDHISVLCHEEGVSEIVLGESLDFHGKPNPVQEKIEIFKKELEEATRLPVLYEQEILTTKGAAHIQGKHKTIDASAAALILETFLERRRRKKT